MITPQDLLKKASDLYNSFSDPSIVIDCVEVEYRNCARMAYYVMLHVGMEITDRENPEISMDGVIGTHQKVIRKLLALESVFATDLANDLLSCRGIRVDADYKLSKPFSQNSAYKVLRKAEKTIQKLSDAYSTGT
ncbi:TPA: hypothetical protein I8W54_003257 [Morganella morganii]|nr:hypothetical protein [Morganella morganii]